MSKNPEKFNRECWPDVNALIQPFYEYVEGKPLPQNIQNPQTLIKTSETVRQKLQEGAYEEFMVEAIMKFIHNICQNVIKPELKKAKGNALFQLIRDFWEKFINFLF
jgi:hypothetical protein